MIMCGGLVNEQMIWLKAVMMQTPRQHNLQKIQDIITFYTDV